MRHFRRFAIISAFSLTVFGCGAVDTISDPYHVVPPDCPGVSSEMLKTDTLPPYTEWYTPGRTDGWKGVLDIQWYYCGPHKVEERHWLRTDKFSDYWSLYWEQGIRWDLTGANTALTKSIVRRYIRRSGSVEFQQKYEIDWEKIRQKQERDFYEQKFEHPH